MGVARRLVLGAWFLVRRVPDPARGAGPRASQALILCAKCQVALDGRLNVSTDDVRRVALPVMRHRILCSFRAEAEGITTDDIVSRLIKEIPERATQ